MIALMLSATVLASASAFTGCAGDGLVYDPYGREYHQWNQGEGRFYPGDQHAYWGWRHTG
jgi:hypothetical protein